MWTFFVSGTDKNFQFRNVYVNIILMKIYSELHCFVLSNLQIQAHEIRVKFLVKIRK